MNSTILVFICRLFQILANKEMIFKKKYPHFAISYDSYAVDFYTYLYIIALHGLIQ